MLKEKLILTDVDGVLLHWEWMFDTWIRPMVVLDKISINQELGRKCLIIPIIDVYKNKFNNLTDIIKD